MGNYSVLEGVEVKSQSMAFESAPKTTFTFLYGVLEQELKLYIGYNKDISSLSVWNNEFELDWYKENGYIVVIADAEQESCVFDLILKTEEGTETVRCWYNNKRALELYRIQDMTETTIADREDYAQTDRFQEDYERYLREEATCLEDLQEQQQKLAPFQKMNYEEDVNDADNVEEEDYIVTIDVSDEDCAAYQNYRAVEHIRGRISARFNKNLGLSVYGSSATRFSLREQYNGPDGIIHSRKATTEEKRFERFIKRKVKSLLNERYIKEISTEHYLGIVSVIFEIIRKYTEEEKIVDIFPASYVIPARANLLTALLSKSQDEGLSDEIRRLVFGIILTNHRMNVNEVPDNRQDDNEAINRRLLIALDRLCHVRSEYEQYLMLLASDVFTLEEQKIYNSAIDYIEKLYGYMDERHFREYVHRCYGEASDFTIDAPNVILTIYTDKPMNYYRPDTSIIGELLKYSINVEALKNVKISIKNTDAVTDNAITRIEHLISIPNHNCSTRLIRRNGKREVRKPEFISFT